ncbi:gamma carbonic anhydrase family protein [Serinibacter salmoneus]|uniref:Carbonic anhydrase/acetyltransferase-like protein (Isoleucine patch superfamily) n=1 Tax=Serinibacter salmoneus TaxID=556530 RepID=A0A2A9D284_9MICO|nr:gamma carbonic anhydrase family protein [Serinibacter salmoneus]PFG20481.1 carbonic anhydrase/acetyltransferase-like protein (isoleucine patch superfamily) [Serinibacter salmoneus]
MTDHQQVHLTDRRVHVDPSAWVAPGAVLAGAVHIGARSSVFYGVVLRGDCESITIGERSNLQDGVVVHVDDDYPTVVGDDVSVGHRAVLHGCTIGDGCLIGMSSTVMSGAVVEPGAMVAAGALVTPGKVIPSGTLAAGVPAKVVRDLTEAEKAHLAHNAAHYLEIAEEHRAAHAG